LNIIEKAKKKLEKLEGDTSEEVEEIKEEVF
jgi:hypothetical protein